jgi:F-type H+-transporting ATPase subunit gamma
MSKKADLRRRLDALEEIKGIVTAMKNLSLLEISKLNRIAAAQRQTAMGVEEAVSDFLSFHPVPSGAAPTEMKHRLYLLIGSERGFCGGFNEMVLHRLQLLLHGDHKGTETTLMIVGSRLASKIPADLRVGLSLPGPAAPEEVPETVTEAARYLGTMQPELPALDPRFLTIIYNRELGSAVETYVLEPFARFARPEVRRYSNPPLLQIPSRDLLVLLADQCLLAALYDIFYSSLVAEHRQRVRHMENAIGHLEKAVTGLAHHVNLLRQEEITEELEVIMLNAMEPNANPQF